MQSILKLSIIPIFILSFFTNPIYAVEIKDRNEYLIDVRGDDGDIYLNRLSIHKNLETASMDLSFFGEAQWNLEIDDWEKLLLGIEVGKSFWDFLYIGQSIQLISGQMLDYMAFDADSKSIDATTKIALDIPLLEHFSLRIFEEYSLNIEAGRDEYCEAGTEIVFKSEESYSMGIGWRHTDRVHNLDTDYVSSFLTLNF